MTTENQDFDRERELGRLSTAANVYRMRGQWSEAEEACRQALAIVPEDVGLQEMLADIMYDRGRLEEALEQYKAAMALAPGKLSLEKKHAKVVLDIGDKTRARELAEDMITNPKKYTARERKPMTAVFASVIVPGLGQLYNGQALKAGIIFGSFLLFLLAFRFLQVYPAGVRSLGEMISMTHPAVIILGLVAFVAYIYGIIDAPMVADKLSKNDEVRKQIEPQ